MDASHAGHQRDVVLLGSTGSIGTQAADIVRRNPGRFRLVALAAGGGNPGLLASQALEFGVEVVAVADEAALPQVRDALEVAAAEAGAAGADNSGNRQKPLPKLLAGADAVAELA